MNRRYLLLFAAIILSASTFYGCEENETPKPHKDDDETSPTVTFVFPPADATDVAVDTSVSVTFSEEINAFSVTTDTFSVTGDDAVEGEIELAGGNLVATFTPSANLSNGTTYSVTLTSGIKDIDDNSLTSVTWDFTTVAAPQGTQGEDGKVFGTAKFGKDNF